MPSYLSWLEFHYERKDTFLSFTNPRQALAKPYTPERWEYLKLATAIAHKAFKQILAVTFTNKATKENEGSGFLEEPEKTTKSSQSSRKMDRELIGFSSKVEDVWIEAFGTANTNRQSSWLWEIFCKYESIVFFKGWVRAFAREIV